MLLVAELCLVITMSGAALPNRRFQSWFGLPPVGTLPLFGVDPGCQPAPLERATVVMNDSTTGSFVGNRDVTLPTTNGPVQQFLSKPGVRDGLVELLAAMAGGIPSHKWSLDVVRDPNEAEEDGFLMLSIHMSPQDEQADAFVEKLIDDFWLALPANVRRELAVGREFVSMD